MPRRLVTARSARLRLDAAEAWLEARKEGCLVLAASQRAGQEVLRAAAARSGGLFGARAATPLQLAAEILLRTGSRSSPLAPLAVEGMVYRALARVLDDGGLEFFGPVADTPGFLRALARTLDELRAFEVDLERVASIGARGRDLRRLGAAFRQCLEEEGVADRAAILSEAAERVDRGSVAAPLGSPLLIVDAPLRTPVEGRFVGAVAARASAVLAVAPAGDPGVPGLEAALEVAAEESPESVRAGSALSRARIYVFGDGGPETPAGDRDLVLFSAPGAAAEGMEIARRLVRLGGQGMRFDRCAVLLRDPTSYQPVVEEALRRAGVPAYFSRGVVRPDPAGRAFLALLECAAEGLSASRFAEYLSFAQVPGPDATGGPPLREVPWLSPDSEDAVLVPVEDGFADGSSPEVEESEGEAVVAGTLRTPMHWERLLVEASVVGGLERWRRRLSGLREELRLRREALQEDPARAESFGRQLDRLGHLEAFAMPLMEILAELPGERSWGAWLRGLESLAGRSLREPARVLRVLAELRPMAPLGPVGLPEVRRTLTDRLRSLRATPREGPEGRVFVGGLDDARGRSFHTVFVPGLAEGVFPGRIAEDPLLLDPEREELAVGLSTRESRNAEERLLLRLALGAAEMALVASYPSLDASQGRARVPSFYALDLVRAAEGRLPEQVTLERAAHGESSLRPGWSVPRAPEDAVDEGEYDIAVLAPLLVGRDEVPEGAARYLLRAGPSLDRSLRARWWRWVGRSFGSWDGLVDPEAPIPEQLADASLLARPYSATALQGFAACPYRFYLQSLVGLRPRDASGPLQELDPLTRGQIFHEVQARFLRSLAREGRLPVTGEGQEDAFDRLDRELDAAAAAWEETLCPALPRVWQAEMESMRQDLRGWLRATIRDADEGWVPRHFELAFGLAPGEGRDEASVREPVRLLDRVLLRGAIDLVESRGDGAIRVTDHKTGRAPDTERIAIGGGERLQPQLYALAAAAMLEREVHSGSLYYCTHRGGYRRYEVRFGEPFAKLALERLLDLIGDSVREGFLPAAPRAGACRWCDYRLVCGPGEETRTARKKKDRLEPLLEMREEA